MYDRDFTWLSLASMGPLYGFHPLGVVLSWSYHRQRLRKRQSCMLPMLFLGLSRDITYGERVPQLVILHPRRIRIQSLVVFCQGRNFLLISLNPLLQGLYSIVHHLDPLADGSQPVQGALNGKWEDPMPLSGKLMELRRRDHPPPSYGDLLSGQSI